MAQLDDEKLHTRSLEGIMLFLFVFFNNFIFFLFCFCHKFLISLVPVFFLLRQCPFLFEGGRELSRGLRKTSTSVDRGDDVEEKGAT